MMNAAWWHHQFTSVKKHVPKIYFTIEMQPNIFVFKLFLVPYMYAFTDCNLRVGKFDVSASNMSIFGVNISPSLG